LTKARVGGVERNEGKVRHNEKKRRVKTEDQAKGRMGRGEKGVEGGGNTIWATQFPWEIKIKHSVFKEGKVGTMEKQNKKGQLNMREQTEVTAWAKKRIVAFI